MHDARCRCAVSSASAISIADSAAPRSSGSGPRSSRVCERLAFEVLHDQEVGAVAARRRRRACRCADGSELRDRARLALEALPELRARRASAAGRTLIATVRSSRVSRALIDLAHPAGAERREDLVGAEARACGKGHVARF